MDGPTRAEHLEWCKQRAREYLDRGQPLEAFTSMCSDLDKHPATAGHVGAKIGFGLMMLPNSRFLEPDEMRRFIEGFN